METIRASLPCLRCGYDLTGQPLEGRCPECTMPVVSSLAAAVEHEQHPQVALRSPIRIAIALLACGIGTLLAVALQLGAPMLTTIDSLMGRVSRIPGSVRLIGWIGSAAVIALAAILLQVALLRREGALRNELGRWRWWLIAGAWSWAVAAGTAAVAQWNQAWLPEALRGSLPWAGIALQLPGMAATLSGLHALLAITGRRSQAFTEAQAARQSLQLLNATAALALVLSVASPILQYRLGWMLLAHTSRALAGCLGVLLLFGAAYLVANTWWVARALILPPVRVDRVLGG